MTEEGVAAARQVAVSEISTMKVDLPHMMASAAPVWIQDTNKPDTMRHLEGLGFF
jgi:hypothetical protein